MSAMIGADADSMSSAAAQLRAAADELDQYTTALTSTLGSVDWLGRVAGQFLGTWSGVHRARLSTTSDFIREAAGVLERNAQAQRQTSAASGGGSGWDPRRLSWIPEDRMRPFPWLLGPDGFWNDFLPRWDGWPDRDGVWAHLFGDAGQLIGEVVGIGGTVLDVLDGFGHAVPLLGKVGPYLGIATGAVDYVEGILEGDVWQMGDGMIGMGLGVGAAVFGLSNPAGWAVLAGSAVWMTLDVLAGDKTVTEWLADGAWNVITATRAGALDLAEGAWNLAEGAWNATTDFASDVADTVDNVTEAVGDFAGDVAGIASDAAGGAVDFVKKF